MSFTRRNFLVGAGSGISVLVLTACTDDRPVPTPTPTPTDDVPAASGFYRSNWANDAYARGATSFLPVGASPQSRDALREPVMNRIFLAGEAISDVPGTIRGAMESGRAAARRVLTVTANGERIAVVGAGAAGAEAARVLQANGVDVIVVEARDRTGGRIDSRVAGDDSYFELGAWRLAEESDASVIEALSREGVDIRAVSGGSAFALEADGTVGQLDADNPAAVAAADALAEAVAWAQQQPRDLSLADAVIQSKVADGIPSTGQHGINDELLLGQLLLRVSAMTGADRGALGSWFFSASMGETSSVPDGPMSAFIDATLDGVDTVLSTTVAGVAYDDGGVSLRLGTGESLSIDRAIVTVPLGVLQHQIVEFDPPLPLLHRSALDELSVGNVELIRMEFETAFWDTDATVWMREGDDEGIRLWINLLPATGLPVLLAVVGGDSALALADLDDDEVRQAALTSLAPFARSSAWETREQ